MGQLIHGKWVDNDDPQPKDSHYHELGTSEFPFDENTPAGRYHLYVSRSCPFALRADIARNMKQLDSKIGISVVNPVNTPQGWSFEPGQFKDVGDKVGNAKHLYEVYAKADPDFSGRVTVPLLIDTHSNRIVSHESADIVDIFNKISKAGPDLAAHAELQEGPSSFFQGFFGSVHKVGRATDQKSYDETISNLLAAIDKIEEHLKKSGGHFLTGKDVTAVDVRTLPAFILYEIGLSVALALSGPRLRDYPHLDAHIRALYQYPGVSKAINVEQSHYGIFAAPHKFLAAKTETIIPFTPQLDWSQSL